MSNRRKIRETVVQSLYACRVGSQHPEEVLAFTIQPALQDQQSALKFAERLFITALDHQHEIDAIIASHASNWEVDRLAVLDRVILNMAIAEILYFDDIPTKVTINEAIEIAKKFSTGKSGSFVNGILDAIVLTFHRENRLHKSGRGLIDKPRMVHRPHPPNISGNNPDTEES